MANHIVLTDATLRVLLSLLPQGRLHGELVRARDPYLSGRINPAQARMLARLLTDPTGTSRFLPPLIPRTTVLHAACAQYRQALDALAPGVLHAQRGPLVFLWDPNRDGPEPAATCSCCKP